MSVRELVKEIKGEARIRAKVYEDEEQKAIKKQKTLEFRNEVKDIIRRFESKCFNIDSTERVVADFIIDYGGHVLIAWPTEHFPAIKFATWEDLDHGHTPIKQSRKFTDWKKAMEKKFGIIIEIRKQYQEHERFGNSGYKTFPDYTYEGVIALVSVN